MYLKATLNTLLLLLRLIYEGEAAELNVTEIYPQPRIVGGKNAYEGQFPYQISLQGSDGQSFCGGSIISAKYVVTAAHCVKNTAASKLSIRAGSRLANSGGQVVKVAQIKIHPSNKNFANDIALLRLSTALKFNKNVKAIALASCAPSTGAPVITSGWGRLSNSGSYPNELKFNTLTAVTQADCRRRLSVLPKSVFCLAHKSGNGVCSGDSGGPAVYKNKLVGVTNFTAGRCGSNNPDGFASVAYHLKWLKSNSDL